MAGEDLSAGDLRRAARRRCARDERVFVIGEDVGVYGGAFKVTQGFQEEFGEWRVIDAPLAETAIVGACTGAAMMGMRPVAEMQFADFVSCAWDHLVTVAAKQHYRAGTPVPIVVRLPVGRRLLGRAVPLAEPGVELRAHPGPQGRLPGDAGGREGPARSSAIRDPNPVLYFEHKHLYRRIKDEVPDERTRSRSARRASHREGDDVTVVTWGAMVYTASEAAERASRSDGISVEILDLRTIDPLGPEAVLASVEKTSKVLVLHEDTRTGGFGAEIAATIAEEAFEHLDAPVKRHRRARHAGTVLAAAREGASSRRSTTSSRASRSSQSTESESRHRATGPRVDVVMPQMGVSVSEGTVTKWLKQGRGGRSRRDAARDLDRQGRHRGAEPGHRRRRADPRAGGRDGRRRHAHSR